MCASNSHSYTHLILALGIVRKPTVWGLLLQNILAYMTLACLLGFMSGARSMGPARAPVFTCTCCATLRIKLQPGIAIHSATILKPPSARLPGEDTLNTDTKQFKEGYTKYRMYLSPSFPHQNVLYLDGTLNTEYIFIVSGGSFWQAWYLSSKLSHCIIGYYYKVM